MENRDPKKPLELKSYTEPKLIVYGSISDLTKSMGPNGNPDGGMAPRSKTLI